MFKRVNVMDARRVARLLSSGTRITRDRGLLANIEIPGEGYRVRRHFIKRLRRQCQAI
jgi:hypothetical protein